MYRPKEVADKLGISGPTLRVWAKQFATWLSATAQGSVSEEGTPATRNYSDDDLRVLLFAKRLLAQGLNYEQVRGRLNQGIDSTPLEEVRPLADREDVRIAIVGLQAALSAKDETIAALRQTVGEAQARADAERARANALAAQLDANRFMPPTSGSRPQGEQRDEDAPPPRRSFWQRLTGKELQRYSG